MSKSRNSKYYRDDYDDDNSSHKKKKIYEDRRELKRLKNSIRSKDLDRLQDKEEDDYA